MKLKHKLMISQILVFFSMFIILTTVLSDMVYMTVSKSDCEKVMNLNEQIMTRIDQSFEELQRFTSVVTNDEQLGNLINAYIEEPNKSNSAKIRLYLSSIGIKDQIKAYAVLGIYVDVNDGKDSYNFGTVGLSSGIRDHVRTALKNTRDKENGFFIEPFSYNGDSSTVFGNKFNMAYAYVMPYQDKASKGTVTVISTFDQISYIAENMQDYSNDYLLLNNENEAIRPSVVNTAIDVNRVLSDISYGETYKEGYYKEKDAVTTVRFSDRGDWKIVCRLTRKDILQNNHSLILFDKILVAVFGICVILTMIPLVEKFTKPLSKVSEQMNEIAKGNLSARVLIESKDEIAEVGQAFNIMAEKLQENIHTLLEQEKREQKMRYSLLVSQVDPHFIYNTMNTITYLAQKNRNEDVIAVNKAMIEILKDRLRINMEDVYDTLEQEVKVVEQYLIIQSYRYADTFKTKINIQEAANKCYIAKNILQPIVENALFHGILCNRDEEGEIMGGCIEISAYFQDDFIHVNVKDNGIGMTEEILEGLENQSTSKIRGEHIGIRNIKGRIKHIYGENCTFEIHSKKEEGTEVHIKLPVVYEIGANHGGFSIS